jgi:hypothetical protein
MLPPSAWDDYFDALAAYLESVDAAVAGGRLAEVPARLASRPRGALPAEHQARWASLDRQVQRAILATQRRRDQVLLERRSLRACGRRPAPRSGQRVDLAL